jgi:hypothetical protein
MPPGRVERTGGFAQPAGRWNLLFFDVFFWRELENIHNPGAIKIVACRLDAEDNILHIADLV